MKTTDITYGAMEALFVLQYRNNPRNNPGLYGLLDGVERNVE